LQRVLNIVDGEHLTWLAVRDVSRIARDLATLQMFAERVDAAGLELYHASGAVQWSALVAPWHAPADPAFREAAIEYRRSPTPRLDGKER
jgi:hypothetical protein